MIKFDEIIKKIFIQEHLNKFNPDECDFDIIEKILKKNKLVIENKKFIKNSKYEFMMDDINLDHDKKILYVPLDLLKEINNLL
jgi:hypothetical protein